MIPAILSCLFVAYLYRSLNAGPANEPQSPDQNVADRLTELERRLQKLSAAINYKGSES